MSTSDSLNSFQLLVGLAIHYSELRAQLASIDARPGVSQLKQLERAMAEMTLDRVQKNILDLLEASKPISAHLAALSADVERMNSKVSFDRSVFLMTKFPDDPGGTLKDQQLDSLTTAIENALHRYGLVVRRADLHNFASSKQLWDNVRVHMLACRYGIAVLESQYKDEFNPNVALEYGFMSALGREVILLIEKSFTHRRADIVGTLGKSFAWSADSATMQDSITKAIDSWMMDIGLPKITDC